MSGLFPGLPGGFPGLIGGLTGSAPSPYVEYLAALMVSVFINAGFFFAELAFLSSVPAGSVRSRIEALGHTFAAPVWFISFYSADFFGTLLFFASMWSFLCGAGKARPTYLSVCPCGVAKVGSDAFLRWFEALWLLLHHVLTGSIKLSLDLGILNVDEGALSGNMLPAKHLLQLWVAGAMFEHVACGMRHFGIKGSASTRVLSVVLRFSAALTLTITQNTPLRMAMAWDVFWMLVRLAINFKRVSASSALLRSQSVGDPLRDPERGAAPDGVAGGKKEGLCAMIGRLNDADVALSAEEEERLLLITRDPEIPARRRSPTQAPPSPAPIYNSARNSAQAARNSARASGRGPSDSMQGVLPPPSTPPPGFTEVGIDSVPSSEERAPSGKSKRKSLVETTAL